MPGGPQPMTQAERMALAHEIANRARELYDNQLLAVGLYGSLARGTDGPYSDLEMMCVLRSSDEDYVYEWAHGPWKAEVNFYSQDILLQEAAEVDERWPLTHGAYSYIRALYDPDEFFVKLSQVVAAQPEEKFTAVIRGVIVGELYEWVGKLRNAQHSGHTAYLPVLALDLARYGAYIIGLANRYCYSTGARALEEALTLPARPPGYDTLCQMVMQGDLGQPERIIAACEAFWAGIERWAAERRIRIEEEDKIPF